ncbi:MAG: undecaprenyl diphosphate synthase family protein [Vicinamibacterales bacterium]
MWQAAFAEYHFTPVYWPAFGPEHLNIAVADYLGRDRRFGGLNNAEPAPAVKI